MGNHEGSEIDATKVCSTWPEDCAYEKYDISNSHHIYSSERFIKHTIKSKMQEQIAKNKRSNYDKFDKADTLSLSDSSIDLSEDDDDEGGLSGGNKQFQSHTEISLGSNASNVIISKNQSGPQNDNAMSNKDGLQLEDDALSSEKMIEDYERTRKPVAQKSINNARAKARAMGVKFREDRNVTVDITPRNLGRKVTNHQIPKVMPKKIVSKTQSTPLSNNHTDCLCDARPEDLGLTQDEMNEFRADIEREVSQANTSDHQYAAKKTSKPISVVTVDYVEDSQVESSEKKTKLRKGRRPNQEVETMMSKLDKAEKADKDNQDLPVSQLLHKSVPEQNYYEVARSGSRMQSRPASAQSALSDKTEEEGSVVMTTKTVQFGLDGPQETVLKSAMSSHPEKKVKDVYSAPLLPSTIKKQKVSSTDILDCFFSFSA